MEEIIHNSLIIGEIIKKIKERDSSKQIGKTFIQKIMYLLAYREIISADFKLYHYGTYSDEVNLSLEIAEDLNFVSVEWINGKGYDIQINPKLEEHLKSNPVDEKITREIERIIEQYISYTASDLAIIATAIYMKENFDIQNNAIAEAVAKFKKSPIEHVDKILKKESVY